MLFKEFGGVDAWPICLDTKDADEIVRDGRGDRARLRRHQPRGHLRAALLRDRAAAAASARHPGVPRRPARHGDRRAGGAPQRAAASSTSASRTSGSSSSGVGAAGVAMHRACCWRLGVRRRSSAATARARIYRRPRRDSTSGSAARRERTNPDRFAARLAEALDGRRRVHRRLGAGRRAAEDDRARWPRADRLRDGQPDAGDRARGDRAPAPRWSRPAARDYPNQINNVLAFPGVFRGALDVRAPRRSPKR